MQIKFCEECGSELSLGAKFCSNCGHSITTEEPQVYENVKQEEKMLNYHPQEKQYQTEQQEIEKPIPPDIEQQNQYHSSQPEAPKPIMPNAKPQNQYRSSQPEAPKPIMPNAKPQNQYRNHQAELPKPIAPKSQSVHTMPEAVPATSDKKSQKGKGKWIKWAVLAGIVLVIAVAGTSLLKPGSKEEDISKELTSDSNSDTTGKNTDTEDEAAVIAGPAGNTSGNLNLSNLGMLAVADDWVYYRKNNMTNQPGIYRIKLDGTGEEKISESQGTYINVSGDYIYYRDHDNFKAYRMKKDGSSVKQLGDAKVGYLGVFGNLIYFTNKSDNNRIYTMSTGGKNSKLLADVNASALNYQDEWLYYRNIADEYKLYRVKADGSDIQKISDLACAEFEVAGDWIIYTEDTMGKQLYKIKTDGTQNTAVDGQTLCSNLNACNGKVYYNSMSAFNNICRIEPESAAIELVTHWSAADAVALNSLYIGGNWIFAHDSWGNFGELGEILKVRPDGTSFSNMSSAWEDGYIAEDPVSNSLSEDAKEKKGSEDGNADPVITEDSDLITDSDSASGNQASLNNSASAGVENSHGNIANLGFAVLAGDKRIVCDDFGMNGVGGHTLIFHPDNSIDTFAAEICMTMDYDGEFVYYSHFIYEKGIYRRNPESSDYEKIIDSTASFLCVEGDWLYYCDADQKLYRAHKDGSKQTYLADSVAYINVVGNEIYYLDGSDESGYLTHMNADGTGKERLLSEAAAMVVYEAGWLYYINIAEDFGIYKVRTDGSGNQRILEEACRSISVEAGVVHYTPLYRTGLYTISTDGNNPGAYLSEEDCLLFNIVGDKIVCLVNSDGENVVYTLERIY